MKSHTISAFDPQEDRPYNEHHYISNYTTKTDLQALKTFKRLHILDSTNIVRSYSLQYGKVGLAIDYKKKQFVLRLRLECEQFMLEFPSSESIIEWYNAITLGIDNSLDLTRREFPKYRSVPRRRRRRYAHGNTAVNHMDALLMHRGDVPRTSSLENIFGSHRKAAALKSHGSSASIASPKRVVNTGKSTRGSFVSKVVSGLKFKRKGNFGNRRTNSGVSADDVRDALKNISITDKGSVEGFGELHPHPDDDEEDEEEEEDDEEGEMIGAMDNMQVMGADADELDDLDDESSEEDEPLHMNIPPSIHVFPSEKTTSSGSLSPDMRHARQRVSVSSRSTNASSRLGLKEKNYTPNTSTELFTAAENEIPLRRYESYIAKSKDTDFATYSFRLQRKVLKDAMRCIPPMIENERWANKFIVMDFSATYSPKDQKAVQNHFKCEEIVVHLTNVGPRYIHRFQRKLQEWVVTPSGLIPCLNLEEYAIMDDLHNRQYRSV